MPAAATLDPRHIAQARAGTRRLHCPRRWGTPPHLSATGSAGRQPGKRSGSGQGTPRRQGCHPCRPGHRLLGELPRRDIDRRNLAGTESPVPQLGDRTYPAGCGPARGSDAAPDRRARHGRRVCHNRLSAGSPAVLCRPPYTAQCLRGRSGRSSARNRPCPAARAGLGRGHCADRLYLGHHRPAQGRHAVAPRGDRIGPDQRWLDGRTDRQHHLCRSDQSRRRGQQPLHGGFFAPAERSPSYPGQTIHRWAG